MNALAEYETYVLAVVAALVLAGIAIGGMNAMGYNTVGGTVVLTVTPSITISLPLANNTVNFMGLGQGASNNTATYNPKPFIIQNDGNVRVNITVGATSLFNTSTNPTSNYQFAANTSSITGGEGTCFFTPHSNMSATNMPLTAGAGQLLHLLNFTDSCDEAECEIYVTVPAVEAAGAKSSAVSFTSVQGE